MKSRLEIKKKIMLLIIDYNQSVSDLNNSIRYRDKLEYSQNCTQILKEINIYLSLFSDEEDFNIL